MTGGVSHRTRAPSGFRLEGESLHRQVSQAGAVYHGGELQQGKIECESERLCNIQIFRVLHINHQQRYFSSTYRVTLPHLLSPIDHRKQRCTLIINTFILKFSHEKHRIRKAKEETKKT